MKGEIIIPGYLESVASEQRDRSVAMLGLGDVIAGIEVERMTPIHMDWFSALNCPVICGGTITEPAMLQFLWILQRDFCLDDDQKEAFIARFLESDFTEIWAGIQEYLERTFLDAPHGGREEIPYYCNSVYFIRAMSAEPFRWTMEQTMKTPLQILYQLLKCDHKMNGGTVVNKRSHKVRGDWMDDINARNQKERENA